MTCSITSIASFNEESSGSIGFSITGLDSEAVTPNTFSWTLTDVNGTVINSREDVSETPAATTWIDLEGLDLVLSGVSNNRVLTAKGTMNTTRDGVAQINKPYTVEKRFDICKVLNVP